MTDIEIVREAIELFTVHYFDNIEMAGTVKAVKTDDVNYLSVNLTNVEWDENLDKLHQALIKYLKDWVQKNGSSFNDYVSISRLTIEYILPDRDGYRQNQSKNVKLFYLPSYYYRENQNKGKTYSGFALKVLVIWHNILLRNTIITITVTAIFIGISAYKAHYDSEF
jgi:hypothetical protein